MKRQILNLPFHFNVQRLVLFINTQCLAMWFILHKHIDDIVHPVKFFIGIDAFSDGMPLGKVFALSKHFVKQNVGLQGKALQTIYFTLVALNTKVSLWALCSAWEVTRLKGEHAFDFFLSTSNEKNLEKSKDLDNFEATIDQQDNSLSNQILLPRKKPGVYMIHCLNNDRRYYGETKNISARLASHRSLLRKNIHINRELQHDWNVYSEVNFQFIPLFLGDQWLDKKIRLQKELFLVVQNPDLCYNHIEWHDRSGDKNPFYNQRHTEESRRRISIANSRPNDRLGKGICLNGVNYPSIAEASRQTSMARKTIRKRLEDPNDTSCKLIELPKYLEKDN
jgi:hypothetical protein